MLQKELSVEAAGHACIAERDQRIIFQLLQTQVLAGKGRKSPAAHQHLVECFQFHHFQAAVHLCRGGYNGKIHLAVFHSLHGLRRGVVGNAQPDAGVLGVEGAQLL